MQIKVLAFFSTFLIITSCMSKNSQAFSCKKEALIKQGLHDGKIGVNHLDSIRSLCKKWPEERVVELYSSGHQKGLQKFCSSERAKKRALLSLEVENECRAFNEYVFWFEKSLESHCTEELALKDSQNFEPSNLNCLKLSAYKKTFSKALQKLCTKKWAFTQGFHEKELNSYCLNTKQKKSLLLSYRLGLEKKLTKKNSQLQIKATNLKSKIKILKNSVTNSEAEKISNKSQQDRLSKELFETLHAIEHNKQRL